MAEKKKVKKKVWKTTCDGCSFEKCVDTKDNEFRMVCTLKKGKRTIMGYPNIPAWCPLPDIMKSPETLLTVLNKYLDKKQDELYEVLKMHEELGEKYGGGWMITDQRLYELDEVYEFIDRVTKTNIKKEGG